MPPRDPNLTIADGSSGARSHVVASVNGNGRQIHPVRVSLRPMEGVRSESSAGAANRAREGRPKPMSATSREETKTTLGVSGAAFTRQGLSKRCYQA